MRAVAFLLLLDVSAGTPTFHPRHLGLLKSLCPHTKDIYAIDFTPDGRRLITCGEDGQIHVLRTGSWVVERSIAERATHFAISPDSRRLATVNPDGSVRVWKLSTGEKESDIAVQSIFLSRVAFSPDGKKLVGLEPGGARMWDAQSLKELYQIDGLSESSHTIVFSPDSSEFLAVRMNGAVTIFSSADGKEEGQFEAVLEPIRLAMFPDGKRAVCAAGDGAIRILDLPSRKVVQSIGNEPLENMPVAALTDDGRYIVGSKGNTVDVHDLRGKESAVLKHHTAAVFQIAVSKNNRYIASVAGDSQLKIWGYRAQGMKGVKPKGFLGVLLNDPGNGVVVDQVIEKSAAEKAGFQVEDRILKIAGVEVKSTWHAIGLIGGNDEGSTIEVVVERAGAQKTFKVTLGPRPEKIDQ